MTGRYRREKLAREPVRVRGWRTVRAGAHRVRVALLPGGGSVATSLLHPIRENPSSRHCSRCGLPGHDRRAHRNPLLAEAMIGGVAGGVGGYLANQAMHDMKRNPRRTRPTQRIGATR